MLRNKKVFAYSKPPKRRGMHVADGKYNAEITKGVMKIGVMHFSNDRPHAALMVTDNRGVVWK